MGALHVAQTDKSQGVSFCTVSLRHISKCGISKGLAGWLSQFAISEVPVTGIPKLISLVRKQRGISNEARRHGLCTGFTLPVV